MNHIYLIRFVLLKRPGFQSQKYDMPNYVDIRKARWLRPAFAELYGLLLRVNQAKELVAVRV